MRDTSLKASVQYGDYNGTAAADEHDRNSLKDLAAKHGIDSERYWIFGIEVSIGETRGDTLGPAFVYLLAIDSQAVKAYGVGAVQEYVNQNAGVLPYVKLKIEADLEDVLLRFKRFNVVLNNSHLENVREYDLTQEE